MVTISNFFVRTSQDGKPFIALELTGDLELIQSSETGRFYASAKKCTMSSTFSEEVAKTLVGKQISGRIERVKCDPYEYRIDDELVTLTHTYVYTPEETKAITMEQPSEKAVDA